MAVGTKSDFKIYHEEFFGGLVETLQQNATAFNGASRGALSLVTRRMRGEFEKDSFFKEISALVARRDPTSTAGVTDTAFTQGEWVGVKLNRRIGPVSDTLDAFRKIAQDPQEFSFLLGQQIGPAVALNYLNTGIKGLVAALGGVSALTHTDTGATISTNDLVDGISKLGDRAERVVAWVMHSKAYYDLVKSQITDNILDVTGMVVRQGSPVTLGRPVIITDASDLKVTDGVSSGIDKYRTLGLVAGAAEVAESEEQEIVSDLVTGEENLRMRIQGEYAFNLKLRGFAWDVTNGAANPTDAAIATASNWDKASTDNKSLAGVLIETR
jgi:hypothetical protein